jgi:hypothetical protein
MKYIFKGVMLIVLDLMARQIVSEVRCPFSMRYCRPYLVCY